MNKVYIVTTAIPYEGDMLESVWSTEEKAKKAKEILENKQDKPRDYVIEITEWEIDHE